MAKKRWVCPLNIVAATGDVTQLYPATAPAGASLATATPSDQVRCPSLGAIISMQPLTDLTNSFVLQLYDINGIDLGIDVSSGTAITDAQLTAAIAAGKAELIFEQQIAGSGLTPITPIGPAAFMRGLAARAVGSTGTCKLNLDIDGGYYYRGGTV
jgi:hypothetical protein